MNQDIIKLYDEYTHKPLTRAEFIKKLTQLTGSMAAAMSMLPFLEVNYSNAYTVAENELFTERIEYAGAEGAMKAYVARPLKEGKYPTVMVIHENRGLNPHIEDVTRRAAQAGYLAIAPDALSPLGGTVEDADKARDMFGKLDAAKNLTNFVKGVDYAAARADSTGKVGCVGFCWGGAMANNLAVNAPNLKAAVAFYGRQPIAEDVPKIKAAVQLHYGGLDERVNAGSAAYEKSLKDAGKTYELYMYDNVNHAFYNDTAPTRYNEEAAKLAWSRTLAFFEKYLKG